MVDGTNDALPGGDDDTLFNDVISGAAAPAELPNPVIDPVTAPTPAAAPAAVVQQPAPQPQQTEPAIPPGVLREAKEAARAAERRAMDLEARLAAFERQQQAAQQQPRPRSDPFENTSAFVQEEVQPIIDPIQQEIVKVRETFSRMFAEQVHGAETVKSAYEAIAQGLQSGDPAAVTAYQRAMKSVNPYGDIVAWHKQQSTLQEIGGDLNAYRQRILDEALKDQAFQAKVIEATRAQAQAAGAVIAKPVVSSLPNINKVGAAALPAGQEDDSDEALFSKTTARRQRG